MSFPIEIQSIALNASGIAFEATKSSLVLPAHTSSFQILLAGKPLEPGEIRIDGVIITILNMERNHAIDSSGNGPEFYKILSKNEERKFGLSFNVIEALPFLKIQRSSLINNSLMLVEGEK
jgi:hypothetical protein